ncbi:MAG: asparagine synthase-related protein [Bacteroidota bacterium]
MVSITGTYRPGGRPVTAAEIHQMAQPLCRDGAGAYWTGGPVGLGLAPQLGRFVPPEAVSVTHDHDAGLSVAADLRLDNRDALRTRLGLTAPSSQTRTDAHLLLAAYARWGPDCVQHLAGDFAFALWDARARRLFCARDRIGVRPFYYAHTHSAFAFASEMHALRTVPGLDWSVRDEQVADYLLASPMDPAATFYQSVRRLPPAHTLLVTDDGLRLDRYWALDPEVPHFDGTDLQDSAEGFRTRFVDAIADRLHGAQPVGSFLSGGFDSSSIACVARHLRDDDEPIHTFSQVFDSVPQTDERPYIDAVLDHGAFAPHFTRGDQQDPLADLPALLEIVEEPFYSVNLFVVRPSYLQARKAGVPVILDGLMGDHVVSHGMPLLTELAARGRWLTLARTLRAAHHTTGSRQVYRHLDHQVVHPLLREPLAAWRHRHRPSAWVLEQQGYGQASTLVAPGLLDRTRWLERSEATAPGWYQTPRTVRAETLGGLTSTYLHQALELATKMATRAGTSLRFPYADHRLVEFCWRVPPQHKLQGGWTRAYARTAMRPYLPKAINRRQGKKVMTQNFVTQLLRNQGEALRTLLHAHAPVLAPYVHADGALDHLDGLLRRAHGASLAPLNAEAGLLWRIAVLGVWLQEARFQTAPTVPSASPIHHPIPTPTH